MLRNMRTVCVGVLIAAMTLNGGVAATAKNAKQSVIQKGTTTRARVEAKGIYNQECYDAYYGCMDQFCITDNTNGGSCTCSDLSAEYEEEFLAIKKIAEEAERISTVEVEKVKAGANADIIFSGTREYDEKGNVKKVDDLLVDKVEDKAQKRKDRLKIWEDSSGYDDDDEDSVLDIASKTGDALHLAAEEICREQMPDSCAKDVAFLRQVYSRQIVADCSAFKNSLTSQRQAAELELANAQADVRAALKESFNEANKYDLGTCMVEFKKCMQTEDACGKDWNNCVFTVASENMQNKKAESTANKKVATVKKYDITASTMEILDSKRTICEKVLNQCMAVRDNVWPAFLREAAPTIRVAEQKAESKFRQSCLTNISKCIQTACKDDIASKGVDTMDACLARPDMARSFCKVEIDPCERMEPQIWSYVVDKLAAMRVDACTQEVKDCFTADTRCGPDFGNCIGMDFDYIHNICPIDSLVVCRQGKSSNEFTMDDLDNILMGLYLNIDNKALEQCQELVENKMAEICGSTTDCNRFASDEVIGTGSLRSQKDGTIYRVTGMISFGSIKMGTASEVTTDNKQALKPGEIGVDDYMEKIRERNANVANADGIFTAIEEELNNIAGTINRTIEMIEQDQEIQYCVKGRNLKEITGKNETTGARFPNLLNQIKMQIAISALRQAQDNYNKKLTEEISKATKDASADLAQYMCQKIAENNGTQSGGSTSVDTPLAPPYAISYDVGAGLSLADLKTGGKGTSTVKSGNGNGSSFTKDVTSIFDRDSRTCHVCTTITTSSCDVKGGNWFRKKNTKCDVQANDPTCEDIKM